MEEETEEFITPNRLLHPSPRSPPQALRQPGDEDGWGDDSVEIGPMLFILDLGGSSYPFMVIFYVHNLNVRILRNTFLRCGTPRA